MGKKRIVKTDEKGGIEVKGNKVDKKYFWK